MVVHGKLYHSGVPSWQKHCLCQCGREGWNSYLISLEYRIWNDLVSATIFPQFCHKHSLVTQPGWGMSISPLPDSCFSGNVFTNWATKMNNRQPLGELNLPCVFLEVPEDISKGLDMMVKCIAAYCPVRRENHSLRVQRGHEKKARAMSVVAPLSSQTY